MVFLIVSVGEGNGCLLTVTLLERSHNIVLNKSLFVGLLFEEIENVSLVIINEVTFDVQVECVIHVDERETK